MPVYHTTVEENKTAIKQEGLLAPETNLLSDDNIENTDGMYFLPDGHSDPLGYAHQLVSTVLEQERPDNFPKHHNCIFFFPTSDLVGELNRSIVFEVDTEALKQNQPIHQAPFDLVTDLFFKTMRQFEISNQLNQDKLHSLAQDYWSNTTQTKPTTLSPNTEVFIHTQKIPPKYITEVSNQF